MTVPLQHHRQKFAERNSFLFAILGVVSLGKKVERLAARPAVDAAPPEDPATSAGVHAVLGLVSLGRLLLGLLESWASSVPPLPRLVDGGRRSAARMLR